MEISGTSAGAAAYALKKAQHMPETLLNLLVQQPVSQDRVTASPDPAPDTVETTGQGRIIDIIV